MEQPGLKNIKKLYENLNYFDQYGGSLVLFIIISMVICLTVTYCYTMINIKPIVDDWPNQRCKPNILPIAGLINRPEGVSALDYTSQNFTYCLQNINAGITGTAVEPLTFITNVLKTTIESISDEIQSIRAMVDKIRNMFSEISQEIMGRILNVTIPLQQIIISFKDLIGKVQGTMTAGLSIVLGSYYTLKALLGAITEFIVFMLIILAILIAVLWVFPFTISAAIISTEIFLAIAIPMIVIMVVLSDTLHVSTSRKIPRLKCFDEDTLIIMNDGTKTKIVDIKNGDVLFGNNKVTATLKLEAKNSIMYTLCGVVVSNSHIVKYNDQWVHVSEHPRAVKCVTYGKRYLYCLNTTSKTIVINDIIFTDWDEIYDDDINEIKNNGIVNIDKLEDIHTYLDGGFIGTTQITLKNGEIKDISEIKVDDILEHGENVYGIVKINGMNVKEQAQYNLGKTIVVGGPNLAICDRNIPVKTTLYLNSNDKLILFKPQNELYHLLTDTKTFYIDKLKVYDYNAAIDLFLVKSKLKLLSMKYV